MRAAAHDLANHIPEAPVWIVPCLTGATPTRTSGSSIYPAVQNMLLAARALGLGVTLTTLYLQFEKEAEAALVLPPRMPCPDRLPNGPVWASPPCCAYRCRLRRSMGPALPRFVCEAGCSEIGSLHPQTLVCLR